MNNLILLFNLNVYLSLISYYYPIFNIQLFIFNWMKTISHHSSLDFFRSPLDVLYLPWSLTHLDHSFLHVHGRGWYWVLFMGILESFLLLWVLLISFPLNGESIFRICIIKYYSFVNIPNLPSLECRIIIIFYINYFICLFILWDLMMIEY